MGIGKGNKRFSVTLTVDEYLALQSLVALRGLSVDDAAGRIISSYLETQRKNVGKDEHNGNGN